YRIQFPMDGINDFAGLLSLTSNYPTFGPFGPRLRKQHHSPHLETPQTVGRQTATIKNARRPSVRASSPDLLLHIRSVESTLRPPIAFLALPSHQRQVEYLTNLNRALKKA